MPSMFFSLLPDPLLHATSVGWNVSGKQESSWFCLLEYALSEWQELFCWLQCPSDTDWVMQQPAGTAWIRYSAAVN